MSARRAPVTPPAKIAKALASSETNQQAVALDGITLYPPNEKRATWRVKFHLAGRGHELSGGKTVETAWATYLAAKDQHGQQTRASAGLPELGEVTVSEMVAEYIREGGSGADWSHRTTVDRRGDFRRLRLVGATVQAQDLNASHVRDYLAAAGTPGRAEHFLGVLSTLLGWGWKRGYLTRDQSRLSQEVTWRPPKGYVPERRGTRRQQAKAFAPTESGAPGGEVPTHPQVSGLAEQVQSRYAFGAGLIHTAANLGLRYAELILLTASTDVAARGRGNFVDTAASEVRVRFQVAGAGGGAALPKGTKIRDVVVPSAKQVATGFDLRAWLKKRCKQAIKEQKQGRNDLALIFPSLEGMVWNYSNVNNRVLTPSLDAMGWAMESYETAHGRKITLRRFTLHSMRDRFATTAINEWGYKEEQLLEQGSWTDAETVRRYYSGTTDDTHSSVRSLHGLA